MTKVVKFPEIEYVLTCRYCGGRYFHIWLGSPDSSDFSEYECTDPDCGARFTFGDVEIFLNEESGG